MWSDLPAAAFAVFPSTSLRRPLPVDQRRSRQYRLFSRHFADFALTSIDRPDHVDRNGYGCDAMGVAALVWDAGFVLMGVEKHHKRGYEV